MKMLLALGLGTGLVIATPAFAQNFSVNVGQPDTIGGTPPSDDILGPGPGPTIPGGLGAPSPTSEVNAFSAGRTTPLPLTPGFLFSVDGAAVGLAGTSVAAQAAGFEAQTDVFLSGGGGFNTLFNDGDGSMASPGGPLGLSEGSPFGTSFLGIDAYEQNPPGVFPGSVFWSVDTTTAFGNPLYIGGGAMPGDVFISPPVPGYATGPALFASAASLGLGPSDDIDALEVYDFGIVGVFDPTDVILFSLTPGSALVGGGFATPGDIYASSGSGSFGLFAPDVALGLAPGDNLNALSVVPEPGSLALLSLGGIGFLGRRRRAAA